MLPVDQWNLEERACEKADVMFVIGTSAVVYPAAELPMIVKKHGGFILEVNVEETGLSEFADASIRGSAVAVLTELVNEIKEHQRIAASK